ncbi:hypothetical protein [Methylobacterium sp. Leaf118]|uniref:hypothetical protein n=1 Tax=Methylobacterium sp. Leaf118 TaxID=2876562 RepID=UPI001E2E336F|nr:hypothetical protein [Methylobacterium sp. Leaf118]
MLLAEAQAQTAEAAKAAAQAADVYINQGVLGTTCVVFILLFLGACLVIRALYKDLKASHTAALAAQVADREKVVLAINAAASAAEKAATAQSSLAAALETNKDASEDLTKQVELAAQETRHAVGNILAAINGLATQAARGRP